MRISADGRARDEGPDEGVEAILRPIFPFVTQRAAEDLDLRDGADPGLGRIRYPYSRVGSFTLRNVPRSPSPVVSDGAISHWPL